MSLTEPSHLPGGSISDDDGGDLAFALKVLALLVVIGLGVWLAIDVIVAILVALHPVEVPL